MANKIVPNFALLAAGDTFSTVWKLTRAMKGAGYTYLASSNGTTTDITAVATADLWGGAADPLTDTYPTLAVGSWWCAQGPSTIRVPIGTVVPTGVFLRGEALTQAVSGATGELLGVVTDTSGGTGYLVISPRTGTFDGTNTITGGFSTATITPPTTTVITYQRKFVVWRNTTTSGHLFYQCVNTASEAADHFDTAARLAAVTTVICPGGATSGANVFPVNGTMSIVGTGGSGAATTGSKVWIHSTIGPTIDIGLCQIMVANAAASAGVSGDGTFTVAYGTPTYNPGSFVGFAFHRLDDQEDGDVDPYLAFCPDYHTFNAGSRTAQVTPVSTSQGPSLARSFFSANFSVATLTAAQSGFSSVACVSWRGFRRRGLATNDSYQDFLGSILSFVGTDDPVLMGSAMIANGAGTNPDTVATAVVTTSVREAIWIWMTAPVGKRMRKGTLRWWYYVEGGSGCDTYDGKRWIQLATASPVILFQVIGPVVAGPWDLTTTPTNA